MIDLQIENIENVNKVENDKNQSIGNYSCKFDKIEEPQRGLILRKIIVKKNGIDITNKFLHDRPYINSGQKTVIDLKNGLIVLLSGKNALILLSTITDKITSIKIPIFDSFLLNQYIIDGKLYLIYGTGYAVVNLESQNVALQENKQIDYIIESKELYYIFLENFTKVKLVNSNQIEIQSREIKKLNLQQDLTNDYLKDYFEKREKSQNGYLYAIGKSKDSISKNYLGSWKLINAIHKQNEFILGSAFPISEGIMDESRTYRYNVLDKYLKVIINDR